MPILRFTFFLHLPYRSSSRKVKPWVLFSMAVAFAVRIFSILKCILITGVVESSLITFLQGWHIAPCEKLTGFQIQDTIIYHQAVFLQLLFFHIFFNFGVFFVPKNYLNPRYFSYSNEYECMLTLSSILYFVKRGCAKFLKVEKLSETFSNTLILD